MIKPHSFPSVSSFLSQLLQDYFEEILRKADYIVTNSKYTMQDIVKKVFFAKEKTSFIYLGYDSIY
jgi:uncharacterized protein YutD